MYCPSCGEEISGDSEFCRHCGESLAESGETSDTTPGTDEIGYRTDLVDGGVYCRNCGETISEQAEICPECGVRQQEPETSDEKDRDQGLAAVASFVIPGLGQVYNGEIAKGIIGGAVTILLVVSVVGAIIGIPMWIWLVYDAYKKAGESENNTPRAGSSTQNEESHVQSGPTTTKEQDPEPIQPETDTLPESDTVDKEGREPRPPRSEISDSDELESETGINWVGGVQLFVGMAVFLFGVGITIDSPVGIPILLIGLALIPAVRSWSMEKLGGSISE